MGLLSFDFLLSEAGGKWGGGVDQPLHLIHGLSGSSSRFARSHVRGTGTSPHHRFGPRVEGSGVGER